MPGYRVEARTRELGTIYEWLSSLMTTRASRVHSLNDWDQLRSSESPT